MRFVAITLALAACGEGRSPSPDAAPDPIVGVVVTGCDDPSLWSVPAVFDGRTYAYVGGGACSPAQYPLHQAWVGWSDRGDLFNEERDRIDRTCWRVTSASAGSGWTAGDTLTGSHDGMAMSLTGFDSTVTIEGRALRDDGTVMLALEPDEMKLDPAVVLDPDAAETTVVLSTQQWVERDAVHFHDIELATDEIVDASGFPGTQASPATIQRTADGFVYRTWTTANDQLVVADEVELGTGTRAFAVKYNAGAVVDSEVLFLGREMNSETTTIVRRVPLAAAPLEVVGNYYFMTLHLPGSLVASRRFSTDMQSISVGDGTLLPVPRDDAPVFFDGAAFHRVEWSQTGGTLAEVFTPRAEDLAAIGTPRAVMHGIVLGERGLLLAVDGATETAGPRVATFADLFADPDARLGPVAMDSAAYVIRFGDGSAKLYNAPFIDYCE